MIASTLRDLGLDEQQVDEAISAIKLMTIHQNWRALRNHRKSQPRLLLESWLSDAETWRFLQVNKFQDVLWFNKEAFESLTQWMYLLLVVAQGHTIARKPARTSKEIVAAFEVMKTLLKAEKKSKYQVDKLLAAI